MNSALDLSRLPIDGAVQTLSRQDDGRLRVTFKNLSAIYTVDEDAPEADAVKAALEQSLASGQRVRLTYALATKAINGFCEVA